MDPTSLTRARLQPATDLHRAWHVWSDVRASTERGYVDARPCVLGFGLLWNGTTRGARAFETRTR